MEFLSYVNIVQASKRIAFFLPLRFYSVVRMCLCYSVYSVGSIGIPQSRHFHFRGVLPTVHEIVEIFVKICFIVVPIGSMAAWSCDLAY